MINKRLTTMDDFPASQKSCYLNAASAALMYSKAAECVLNWQKDLAENGTLNFDEVSEEKIYDNLRMGAAKLLNAHPDDIAGGSSATELLTSLAWAMIPTKGNNLVGTDAAHPSTVYPWQRVARFAECEFRMAKADSRGLVDPEELLSLIDERTAIVIVSHVEYRTGQTYDLKSLAKKVHKFGGHLVVDATQSAGQVPIDVQKMEVDAVVAAGYKWLCGPFGASVMYLSPSLYTRLDPGLVGWRSHKVMWEFRADRLEYPDTARRFEASTMAYGCALGLGVAVNYLNSIGVEWILKHNKHLADLIGNALLERGAKILSPQKDEERSSIISVCFPDRDTRAIARFLNQNNVVVSFRMGAIRISPHLYNDDNDIDQLKNCFDKVLN